MYDSFEQDRTIPFDEFTLVVVDEIGVGIHKFYKVVKCKTVNEDHGFETYRGDSYFLLDYPKEDITGVQEGAELVNTYGIGSLTAGEPSTDRIECFWA